MMSPEKRAQCIALMSPEEMAAVLTAMADPAERGALLGGAGVNPAVQKRRYGGGCSWTMATA